jgi:3-hydroxy acid dehydrogenase/malonic semialdehyde reductase
LTDLYSIQAGLALGAPNAFHDLTPSRILTMNNTEAVDHANKACQEVFTNALRNELNGTDIRGLALRPGCVATNFHSLRVGHDKKMYDEFFEGFEYVTRHRFRRT